MSEGIDEKLPQGEPDQQSALQQESLGSDGSSWLGGGYKALKTPSGKYILADANNNPVTAEGQIEIIFD